MTMFSDIIVVAANGNDVKQLNQLVKAAAIVQHLCQENGFPVYSSTSRKCSFNNYIKIIESLDKHNSTRVRAYIHNTNSWKNVEYSSPKITDK